MASPSAFPKSFHSQASSNEASTPAPLKSPKPFSKQSPNNTKNQSSNKARPSSLAAFETQYHQKKELIETQLKKLILTWEHDHASQPPVLKALKVMKYALLSGGKRIRPCLTLLCYDMLRPIIAVALAKRTPKSSPQSSSSSSPLVAASTVPVLTESMLSLALSIELIHTYSLIHDDLPAMDNASLRRQQPTCHIAFSEAEAILAGDSLLTAAFKIIATVMARPEVARFNTGAVLNLISRAAGYEGMIAGQVFDLEAETRTISLSEIEALHLLKTGKLIEAAFLLPAVFFDLSPFLPPLKTYARAIGLAFQIIDDILDHTQASEVLGKPAQADIHNHKTTYLTFMSVKEAYQHSQHLIETAQKALDTLATLAKQAAPATQAHIDTSALKGLALYIHERNR